MNAVGEQTKSKTIHFCFKIGVYLEIFLDPMGRCWLDSDDHIPLGVELDENLVESII